MKGGPPPTERHHRHAAATTTTTTTTTIRRLSRSFKLSQHARTCSDRSEAPSAAESEFKTPTGPVVCRVSGAPGGESPREADADPDIIWDAASPRRPRGAKRAKQRAPGPVSISDIVSRIAPERGRPQVSEPALQRWIGDSAGIPCTPDVQPPKSRRTSARASNSLGNNDDAAADGLLKLAKRFDLNWIGGHQRDDGLGSGRRPPDGRVCCDPAASSSPPSCAELDPADALFEDFATALCPDVPYDWDDDDPPDDSLLAEVTQNPENFCAPKHSSTQKTSCQAVAPSLSSEAAGKDSTVACGPSAAVSPATNQWSSPGPAHEQLLNVPDFSDAFFSWDDPADDEMLRRLCEDLESRVDDEAPNRSATSSVSDRFPIGRPGDEPVSTAVPGVTGETVSLVTKRAVDNCPVSMVMHHPVPMVTSNGKKKQPAVGAQGNVLCQSQRAPLMLVRQAKCSAQEIERKKQQALERRHRRLHGGGPPHPQMRSASLL